MQYEQEEDRKLQEQKTQERQPWSRRAKQQEQLHDYLMKSVHPLYAQKVMQREERARTDNEREEQEREQEQDHWSDGGGDSSRKFPPGIEQISHRVICSVGGEQDEAEKAGEKDAAGEESKEGEQSLGNGTKEEERAEATAKEEQVEATWLERWEGLKQEGYQSAHTQLEELWERTHKGKTVEADQGKEATKGEEAAEKENQERKRMRIEPRRRKERE